MAIAQNTKINTTDLVNRFKEVVVTRILNGVVDSTNCPMVEYTKDAAGNKDKVPAIEPELLDSKKNISGDLVLGTESQTVINAQQLLTEIIRITRDLTRVGTYVVLLKMRNSEAGVNAAGQNYNKGEWLTDAGSGASGEALFVPSEIRQSFNGTGNNGGVVVGNTIKAADLTNLFANMYEAWTKADRPQKSKTVTICHVICHSPCHSTCHTHCHSTCHGWSGTGKACHDNCEMKMDVYNTYFQGSWAEIGGAGAKWHYINCHSVPAGSPCHGVNTIPKTPYYLATVKAPNFKAGDVVTAKYTNGYVVECKYTSGGECSVSLPFAGNWTFTRNGKTKTVNVTRNDALTIVQF